MQYRRLYSTRCPLCAARGEDKKGNNLAIYFHGAQYCWNCKKFIVDPSKPNNNSFLKQDIVSFDPTVSIKETLTKPQPITDKNVIKFLWQYHLYEEDWSLNGLQQVIGGFYQKTRDTREGPKWPLNAVYVPTVGGYILRQINPEPDKPKVINSHSSMHWSYGVEDTELPIVIVEDVFSGMKLRKAGFAAISLNGTSLKDEVKYLLAKYVSNRKVYIWLDNDTAGKEGTKKIQKYLQIFAHCAILTSIKDPKWYPTFEVKRIIYE